MKIIDGLALSMYPDITRNRGGHWAHKICNGSHSLHVLLHSQSKKQRNGLHHSLLTMEETKNKHG